MTLETMKKETCIFCGSRNLELLIPAEALPDKVGVFKCIHCELVFLESRTGENELDREETAYWDDEEQKKIYMREKVQEVFLKEFNGRLSAIEALRPQKGKLLDVGCGVGHFLATAKNRGWEVEGLDISQTASLAAKELYGLKVCVGTLEDPSLPKSYFGVVSLWDVIEHIRRPLHNVEAANKLLQMGGILAMKTPNEAGFFKQVVLALYRIFGKRAAFLLKYVYYVPHYFSYSKKSMTILLRLCGFEIIRYETDTTPQEFASEKIEAHYKKDPKRSQVIALLPIARFFSRLFKLGNKMIVYAKKVREI